MKQKGFVGFWRCGKAPGTRSAPVRKRRAFLLTLGALLIAGLIGTADEAWALTMPTDRVAEGMSASQNFKQDKGIYSDWENPATGFIGPAEYGFRPKTTRETKFTRLGVEDREGGIAEQEQQFPSGNLDAHWIFNVNENVSGQTGYEGTAFTVYNPKTKSSDKVDVRVTLSDWKKRAGAAAGDPAYITITHSDARPVINLINLECVTLRIETFKSGTSEPYKMKSNFTMEDIDCYQYLAYSMTGNQVVHQYVAKNSELCYGVSEGKRIFYSPTAENLPSKIPEYAAGMTYDTAAFEVVMGSLDGDGDRRSYVRFGFSSYDMTPKEVPEPYKTVTDPDQKQVKGNQLAHANEQFSYEITQRVPSGLAPALYYKSFRMEDEVDACMKILDAKVQDLAGLDRSDWFDVTIEGQNVRAEAKASGLKDPEFYGGTLADDTGYTLKINVALDQSKTADTLQQHGHYNGEKNQLIFRNTGTVTVDGNGKDSNEVTTEVGVPDLEIEKETTRYEWQVTDTVPYTVTVKHTAKSTAPATNLVIQDLDLPKGLELQESSLKAMGIHGEYDLKKVEGGFKLDAEKMDRDETVVITFDALVGIPVNGKIIPNTATVQSYAMTERKQAQESVYINSPKLKLDKTTAKEVYKAGDTVSFEINLTQINQGTFMRDIILTEELVTEGLHLRKGSIQVMDSDDRIITSDCDIRVKDKSFSITTGRNMADDSRAIPPKQDPYDRLDFEKRLTVTYEAEVTADSLAGSEIESVTTAPTRPNTNGDLIYENETTPSGGDRIAAQIAIKPAVLDVEKQVDTLYTQPGKTGQYRLYITQTTQDALAKNVMIRDGFQEWAGMKVQKDSFHITKEGKEITGECTIHVEEKGDSFLIETHTDLAAHEKMTVTYNVRYEDPALAGKTLVNEVVVRGDNAKEDRDDAVVRLKEPRLEIEKNSDQAVYHLGDTAKYQLSLKQTIDHVEAENVQIEDFFQKAGAELIPDSIIVQKDRQNITKDCTITVREDKRGFAIATGEDLTEEDTMQVFYEVRFQDPALADQEVKNTAVAKGDNTPEAGTDHAVTIEDQGMLKIEKDSDRCILAPGDTALYRLDVTGVSRVPVRHVKIRDTLETAGAVIRPDTIEVTGTMGESITKNCEITATEKAFTIQTPVSLEKGQRLCVTYEVQLSAEAEDGTQFENTAEAEGENADPKEDAHIVTIETPQEDPQCPTEKPCEPTDPAEKPEPPCGSDQPTEGPGGCVTDPDGGDEPTGRDETEPPRQQSDPQGEGNGSGKEQGQDRPDGADGRGAEGRVQPKSDLPEEQWKQEPMGAVQTGDHFPTVFFIAAAAFALLAMITLWRAKKKSRSDR